MEQCDGTSHKQRAGPSPLDGSEEDTPKLGLKVCVGVYERRLAKLVYAVLRSRGVEERGHPQGNWRVDSWREGLGGEAGEIIVTMKKHLLCARQCICITSPTQNNLEN